VADYDRRLFTNADHADKYEQVQREADRIRGQRDSGYESPLRRFWKRVTGRGTTVDDG
jgi:hypothetical protein